MNTVGAMTPGALAPTDPTGAGAGANTFQSLKALFKNVNPASKKCKHCGQSFQPKAAAPEAGIKL